MSTDTFTLSLNLGSTIKVSSVLYGPLIGCLVTYEHLLHGSRAILKRIPCFNLLFLSKQTSSLLHASLAENAMRYTYLPAGTSDVIVDLGQKYQEALEDTSIAIEAHLAS